MSPTRETDERRPVTGSDFWAVEKYVTEGGRAPDLRTRSLLRRELAWRLTHEGADKPRVADAAWLVMGGGYATVAVLGQGAVEGALAGVVLLVLTPALWLSRRRQRRRERAHLEALLALNAD